MYAYISYKNKHGKDAVSEYLAQLHDKALIGGDQRFKLKKILTYFDLLTTYGTNAGLPSMEHIEGNIWELNPLDGRAFFAYRQDDSFLLLHHFQKKTSKTPPKELEKAQRNLKDWVGRNGEVLTGHDDFLSSSGLDTAEIAEIKLKSQIVGTLLKARGGMGISQKELETINGISPLPTAKAERGAADTQMSAILRLLEPFGLTLAIVPKQ